jgi:Zn-finger nucleic acid-binding protein
VWLDRGELDKIIERSSEVFENDRTKSFDDKRYDERKYNDKKYDDDYYKKNKRKSFFNDLFDF